MKTSISLLLGILILPVSLLADTIYVDADASGGAENGSSWADAHLNLQDALSAALLTAGDDQIWVAEGSYYPDQGTAQTAGDRGATFQLLSGVSVYGGFDGSESDLSQRDASTHITILSGDIGTLADTSDNSYNIVTTNGTTSSAVLDGFTLTAGNANGGNTNEDKGSALLNDDGAPSISHCIFISNQASANGGAVYSRASSLKIPSFSHCTFTNNTADHAGAVQCSYDSNVVFTSCSFTNNSATTTSGAVRNFSASPTFINCSFLGNQSSKAGALGNRSSSSPTLVNCTFSGNNASIDGGALFNDTNCDTTVANCIIWNNIANSSSSSASASVFNNGSNASSYSYSLIANSNASTTWDTAIGTDGGNNLDADPQFTTAADPSTAPNSIGNLRLKSFPTVSPAIDAGKKSIYNGLSGPATDPDGNARIVVGSIDMGAYEFIDYSSINTHFVNTNNSTPAPPYHTWKTAANNLQDALSVATTGTDIWVAQGTYYPTEKITSTNDRTANFTIQDNISIYGGFNGSESDLSERDYATNTTTLSGDIDQNDSTGGDNSGNAYHVLVATGTATLDGFTITAGYANGTLYDNKGSAIYITAGSPSIKRCSFVNNEATGRGGAIFNDVNSTPIFKSCSFLNNKSLARGGAVANEGASPSITDCSFSSNQSNKGGAISNQSGAAPTITNCSFSGNLATSEGGAISNNNSSPALSNCIIWNNIANSDITSANASVFNSNSSSPTYSHCLIENWNDSTLAGAGSPSGTNFDGITDTDLDGTKDNDPRFIVDANPAAIPIFPGDLRLRLDSPVIDAGDYSAYTATTTSSTDLAGNSRTIDHSNVTPNTGAGSRSYLDIGAYEQQDSSIQPQLTSFVLNTADPTNATDLEFTVKFTEDVFGFESPSHLLINNTGTAAYTSASITAISSSEYTVSLAGVSGEGSFSLSVVTDGSVINGDGNTMDANSGILDVPHIDTSVVLTHHVNTDVSGRAPAPPYSTWATAAATLQDALVYAHNGDQVWVAQGTYYPDQGYGQEDDNSAATFTLKNNVAIYGGFNGSENDLSARDHITNTTTLSGDIEQDDIPNLTDYGNSYNVLTGSNTDSTAILDGFSITAGHASPFSTGIDDGGGLYNDTGSPSLSNCSFFRNSAPDSGGAIFNTSSSPTFTRCSFSNNSAHLGGAVFNENSSPSFTDCSFSGNSNNNGFGGAILNENSSPTLTSCSFLGNSSTYKGGAISNDNSSSPTLTDCSFSTNSAIDGGAISNDNSSSPSLTGCSFSTNSASNGGAIFNDNSSSPSLTNCTMSLNSSYNNGGAMFSHEASLPILTNCTMSENSSYQGGAIYNTFNAVTTLTNCTISENSASYRGGAIFDNSYTTSPITNCTISGNSATFNGGAIYIHSSTSPSITNCTISGNSASSGGAIYNSDSSPTITSCTISGNSASINGGAIFNYENFSTPTLTNCIIWNNSAASSSVTASASVFNNNSSPTYSHCLVENWNDSSLGGSGTNLDGITDTDFDGAKDNDPMFLTAADPPNTPNTPNTTGDLRLRSGSPAIDTGDGISGSSQNSTTEDLAGATRFNGVIDIGCFEGSYAATFAVLYGSLIDTEDENGNGRSNFLDYTMGADPYAAHDTRVSPTLTGNQLTFHHRTGSSDVTPVYQISSNLKDWVDMTESNYYTVDSSTSTGIKTSTTITLESSLPAPYDTDPQQLFFRQKVATPAP